MSAVNAFFARANRTSLALLAGAALCSWLLLATGTGGSSSTAPAFLFGWTVMMAAMMLPSAAPLVLLYAGRRESESLAAGYLVVWALAGVPVFALSTIVDIMAVPAAAVAAVLIAAGAYQLTPVKRACLRRCRSPVSFLLERWGRGAFRVGVEHGIYCVGCCWALMTVLVFAGAMGLVWAAAIAFAVFVEKVLPIGEWAARSTAAALFVLGVAIAVDPALATVLNGNQM